MLEVYCEIVCGYGVFVVVYGCYVVGEFVGVNSFGVFEYYVFEYVGDVCGVVVFVDVVGVILDYVCYGGGVMVFFDD